MINQSGLFLIAFSSNGRSRTNEYVSWFVNIPILLVLKLRKKRLRTSSRSISTKQEFSISFCSKYPRFRIFMSFFADYISLCWPKPEKFIVRVLSINRRGTKRPKSSVLVTLLEYWRWNRNFFWAGKIVETSAYVLVPWFSDLTYPEWYKWF